MGYINYYYSKDNYYSRVHFQSRCLGEDCKELFGGPPIGHDRGNEQAGPCRLQTLILIGYRWPNRPPGPAWPRHIQAWAEVSQVEPCLSTGYTRGPDMALRLRLC